MINAEESVSSGRDDDVQEWNIAAIIYTNLNYFNQRKRLFLLKTKQYFWKSMLRLHLSYIFIEDQVKDCQSPNIQNNRAFGGY